MVLALRVERLQDGQRQEAIEQLDRAGQVGADGDGFYFDNETPRHDVLLHPHRIGNRLVTNGEYREFMRDGGYSTSDLWLSDGWAAVNERGWRRPLYWDEADETEFTLGGARDIDANAPVTHVSYYEADAFARWAGYRLPTEFEWERFARAYPGEADPMARRGDIDAADRIFGGLASPEEALSVAAERAQWRLDRVLRRWAELLNSHLARVKG